MPMIDNFMNSAKGLARNPLGIIALFISLIYGFACLVLGLSGNSLSHEEKMPFVWFLIFFPVLILITFIYLVTRHHQKLYAPFDFRDDSGFLSTMDTKTLIKSITDMNTKLLSQKLNEKVDEQLSKEQFEHNGKDATERLKAIINESFIEDLSKENLKQIQDANSALSDLSRLELSVLYCIWSLQISDSQITIDKIKSESGLTLSDIETATQNLKSKTLLIDSFTINPKYLKIFNNLFDIDEYTGMRFVEKVNALKELIQRIPKVI
ncbi:MAG: hypothetical protein ABI921_03580 [Panacibacter sp.]